MNNDIYRSHSIIYFENGLKTIPLNGKIPVIKEWQKIDITEDLVKQWAHEYSNFNIGAPCGLRNNIIVIDFDDETALDVLRTEYKIDLNIQTPTVKTMKGFHKYFRYPDRFPAQNRVKINNLNIDIRAEGGQIVLPPSIHPVSKQEYRWIDGLEWGNIELAELPESFIQLINKDQDKKSPSKKSNKDNHKPDKILHIKEESIPANVFVDNDESQQTILSGNRNITLFNKACTYRYQRLSLDEAIILLKTVNETQCEIPLPENELIKIIKSAYHYNQKTTFPLSDIGNAERMVEAFGEKIKFNATRGNWFIWNGKVWEEDRTKKIEKFAKVVVRDISKEMKAEPDKEKRKALAKFQTNSESNSRIKAMIERLKAEPNISIIEDDFDKNPLLLNCLNGTIDLKEGKLIPHNPDHMITKMVNEDYNPEAQAPTWIKFLETITDNNAELIEYLQKCTGYSLTGDVSEEVFFFLYGTGSNGKSTFINAISGILSDYSRAFPSNTLIQKSSDSNSNDIAMLNGVRMAITTELPEGKLFNEELIKSITSKDKITARFLFQEFFQFDPTHKFWISGNHKPLIKSQDFGIWRRVRLVPFTVTIPEEKKDKMLSEKLKNESEGILKWLVDGCLKWKNEGIATPKIVQDAIEEYKSDLDIIGNFIKEYCDTGKQYSVKAFELFELFKKYCESSNFLILSKQTFNRKLEERGYTKKNSTNNELHINGLKMKRNIYFGNN